ncbi:MAG: type II secretion system F family protein [Solirubrobacteraceae bacterium]
MADAVRLRRLVGVIAVTSLLVVAWLTSVALGAATAVPAKTAAAKTAAATTPKPKSKPKPKPKPKPPLVAWPGLATPFPRRAVVIAPPAGGATVSATTLHISENGAPVSGVTLARLSAPTPGDFGEIIAVEQTTTMSGTGLTAAIGAVHALATVRPPAAELGLVTFNAIATQSLPLTGNASAISSDLAAIPFSSNGDDTAAGTTAALSALAHAGVAAGAIVVISDGAGALSSASAARQAAAAAATDHVPVVMIGLKDAASTAAGLRALQSAAPGTFLTATPATLSATLAGVQKQLTGEYVADYRSSAPTGQPVSVTVTADGLRGAVAFDYHSPAAVAPAVPRAPRLPGRIDFAKAYSSHGQLSSTAPIPSTPVPAPVAAVTPPAAAAPATFWSSPAAVPVVAILVALLVGVAVALILHKPHHRAVRLRVGSFIPSEPAEPELSLIPEKRTGSGPLAMFARSSWWPPFVEAVEVSRSKYAPNQIVKRSGIAALVVALLGSAVMGSPVPFLLVLLAWPFVVRKLVYRAADKQRAKFADSLPSYLQDLASSIRVGRSFVSALSVVGEAADEPTRSELERAVTDEALGRPLEESLEGVSLRMRSTDMDQVALIAALNRRSGSNVAEALDRVADGARERADLRREIRALTAQAKLSSIVLTALPGVLLVGLSIISPQYSHPLFHTTIGIVVLAFGALLCACGWQVMKKITQVEA